VKQPQEANEKRADNDVRTDAHKRLKSAVVVGGTGVAEKKEEEIPQTEAPKPITAERNRETEEKREVPQQSSEEKSRNRRLLNNLLMGTLATFRKQVENEAQILQKRREVEMQTEEKVSAEHQQFLLEQRKKRQDDINFLQARVERIMKDIQTREDELLKIKSVAHALQLSNFLVTKNGLPPIYYFPVKRDEFTERTLGTKPVPIEIKTEPDSTGNLGTNTTSTTVTTTSSTGADSSGNTNNQGNEKEKQSEEVKKEQTTNKEEPVPVEEAPKKEDDEHPSHSTTYNDNEEDREEKEKESNKEKEKALKIKEDESHDHQLEELAEGVTPLNS